MGDQTDVAKALSHVLWIGGSPCSGKSTISHTIARIYVFVDYHADAFARYHFARRVAAGDAEAIAFLRMTVDERWLQKPVEEMARETIASWTTEFRYVLDDLLALPRENLIVAEGNFFPACVAPYLSTPHQAIWLTPTDAFCDQARRRKRAALARRQKRHGAYGEGSDPEQRLRNLIARDQRLAHYVKQQVEAASLPLIEVDGSQSVEEMTEVVERHFDPYLIAWVKRVRAQAG